MKNKIIVASLGLMLALSAQSGAQTMSRPCGDRAPEHSAAWINFMAAVENNYGSLDDMSEIERNMVLGHAIGRYAQTVSAYDVECVKGKLVMDDLSSIIEGNPTNHEKIRTGAERGQFDVQVQEVTGVTSTAAFSDRDMMRRDDSVRAGPTVGDRFGLSDGSRVRLEDGSTVAIDGSDTGDSSDWFNDEFWGDLPNTPGGGASDPGTPALESRGGLGNVINWRFEGDYRSCYERYRKTHEEGADFYEGGLVEGAFAILAVRKDGRYECYSGNTLNEGPAYQSENIEKFMKTCEDRLDDDMQECIVWYR